MLTLPQKGISRSVNKDNCDAIVLSDWIEASCLFCWERLSVQDVVDFLLEENIYDDQERATSFVRARWDEIHRRIRLTGSSYGLRIEGDVIYSLGSWDQYAAHSFCLALSLATRYDWWKKHFDPDYNEQGELFEHLTSEALQAITPDWECHIGGWSRNAKLTFEELVEDVSDRIGDGSIRLDDWKDSKQKDLTLDILHYCQFLDELPGRPTTFIQCASGDNWRDKIGKPNLEIWRDVVRTFTPPAKGFAVPFCYSDVEFRKNCIKAQGLLLDRLRLLGAGLKKQSWLGEATGDRIVKWLNPFVDGLLKKSELP